MTNMYHKTVYIFSICPNILSNSSLHYIYLYYVTSYHYTKNFIIFWLKFWFKKFTLKISSYIFVLYFVNFSFIIKFKWKKSSFLSQFLVTNIDRYKLCNVILSPYIITQSIYLPCMTWLKMVGFKNLASSTCGLA